MCAVSDFADDDTSLKDDRQFEDVVATSFWQYSAFLSFFHFHFAPFCVTAICFFVLILYVDLSFYEEFYVYVKTWGVPHIPNIKWLGRNESNWNTTYINISVNKWVHIRQGDTDYSNRVVLFKNMG